MDRRGFVTSGMAASLAGMTGAGGALGALLDKTPGWGPGKTDVNGVVRLNSNENPLGISPAAREALIGAIGESNRYGGRRQELMEELARYLNVKTENITLGFGSTEILQVATQAFQGPNTPLIAAAPTFEDVMDYQDTMPFEVTTIPLTADLQHDVGRMREAASKRPSLVYFCNPNNPTGTITSSADIDAWIAEAPETTTFLMDEAYLEYVTDDSFWPALKWIEQKPNVIVIRTFSKIFAMAGLRLGYAVSHPSTAARLNEHTIQNSPNVLAGAAGIASLKDTGIVARSIAVNEESKAIIHQTLDELGLDYLPTNANFLMHKINGDLATYRNRMAETGLLVGRDFPPMLDHNRLSFGMPDEMDRWAATIKDFRRKGWI
ncbi:MAG: aminotransferase class I/II-fold pyridoxal phosphate-dependent enzyme [Gemmatimonadetes bacterium]|nr:aminotransferase class I/II-fold pyridoxal phosphate-dependent enzyme [Gemmatimonadota bacterium]MDA1102417.1 aminotransferase class I/II-fold pyridoxal phosphate-dependent enzyme [Gemmatimonadota bacterium]